MINAYKFTSGEDALFLIEDGAVTLLSRGGSRRKGDARNTHYGKALSRIVTVLASARVTISDAYVDSSATKMLDISEKRIIDGPTRIDRPAALVAEMSRRMKGVGQKDGAKGGNSTKRLRIELAGRVSADRLIDLLGAKKSSRDTRSLERLPAQQLRKVKADDLWFARELLLKDRDYSPFDDSDEYDVLLEDGQRLPPKALFGKALSRSLKTAIFPKHFAGGQKSTCFRILQEHGYEIVRKGSPNSESRIAPLDIEWREGDKKLRLHLRSERSAGLSAAKREQFLAEHGALFCEQCGLEPTQTYESDYATACIEVHHACVAVANMQSGHVTKLEDLNVCVRIVIE